MRPQRVDPYEILGLERGATWAQIRAAYRRLASKHHPDKNPGDKASEWIFKEVGRAYQHLRDIHGAHGQPEERTRHEHDPGRRSDERGERQARAQREREQRQRAERARQEQERAERREREQRERRQAQAARERRGQKKSGRTTRDSREGMGREQRGGRESAWPLFIVAALVLIGIATAIYDALPWRAAQSVTENERQARPPTLSSAATAPQEPVPVGQGSTSSGPSPAPVRVDTDVSPSPAVPSAANAEREGSPARPAGAATTPRTPASVARSRASEQAGTSPSGARPPSAARVGNATVIGWRAADPPDRTEPPARTGASVSNGAFFTRGSHEDDVVRVQGTPTRVDPKPTLGYEVWRYGRDTVRISIGSRQVTQWSNPTGNLKVRLIPGANVTGSAFFTRGSHDDDVVRVQGTPTRIDPKPTLGYEVWRYGRDTVRISIGSRQVIQWSNPTGNLKVRLIPGANATGSAFFTRGSHEDDVVRVQGTPTRIDPKPTLGYEVWRYGRDTVRISIGSRQVIQWSNPTGNLKVRLIPGANATGSAFFTRGSHEDDVVRVQGTPTRVDPKPTLGYEVWTYGRDTVRISIGSRQVTQWSNPTGNLKVRLIPGANATGSAFFTRGSHEDDVVRVQGTPTRIDPKPTLGYEVWRYGRDTVRISIGSRQVTQWSNPTASLRVR